MDRIRNTGNYCVLYMYTIHCILYRVGWIRNWYGWIGVYTLYTYTQEISVLSQDEVRTRHKVGSVSAPLINHSSWRFLPFLNHRFRIWIRSFLYHTSDQGSSSFCSYTTLQGSIVPSVPIPHFKDLVPSVPIPHFKDLVPSVPIPHFKDL